MPTTSLHFQTRILPGHRIELTSPDLPEGSMATVLVVVPDPDSPKRSLADILAGYPGGQLFRTAEEVDAYLRAERDAWDS
ncbi:MAG: hypothetical protein U0736_11370 [Gemmataceae bacterium]